jgi:hypothetical protein
MDKTININLGGTLFQIDEEAFSKLRDYLQAINNRLGNLPGGHETIEDIDSRIAEIFNTQKGLAGVITIENVDAMISIIGKPEDFEHGEPEVAAYAMHHNDYQVTGTPVNTQGYSSSSRVGNAINEVFRAIGRVLYIILRIFLILTGVMFVLIGFLFILCFVMVFIFGLFSIDSSGINLINFTDFLNYIVNSSAVPWIIILTSIVFILPMLALIYWGVKMIFWFKARDGVISLVALVVWVMTVAMLAVISFNEGFSFAENAKISAQNILPHSPDTLYVMSDQKIEDLKFDKEFTLPHKEYSVFINDEKKELYIRPYLDVDKSDNKSTSVEVRKSSAGRTEVDAMKKIDGMRYNYSIKGDTLHLDEYFTSPAGRKWAADNIKISLSIPTGTILKFENGPGFMVHSSFRNERDEYLESRWESGNNLWVMTYEGLEPADENSIKHK